MNAVESMSTYICDSVEFSLLAASRRHQHRYGHIVQASVNIHCDKWKCSDDMHSLKTTQTLSQSPGQSNRRQFVVCMCFLGMLEYRTIQIHIRACSCRVMS